MALKLLFNPFTGKFDYTLDPSAFSIATPQVVANGVTFTVATNTQVTYANTIVVQAGGIVKTEGTAALTYVN